MRKTAIVVSVLLLPVSCLAADMMRPGYWELTTQTEMPGMPIQMPPSKVKHCYSKEDVSDQKKTITTDKNCKVTEMKQSGNKLTWKMKCTGEHPGNFSGESVYRGDSYDATMKMVSEGHTVKMKMKGKYLGACP